jgi:hypothetical protein
VPITCPWLKPLRSNTFPPLYLKSPGTVGTIDERDNQHLARLSLVKLDYFKDKNSIFVI